MENHVSQQLSAYLTAAALGAASAMFYDLLRAVRLRRRRNRRLTGALDAVYIAGQGLLLLWFALRIGQGELRLYMLTGMALGFAVRPDAAADAAPSVGFLAGRGGAVLPPAVPPCGDTGVLGEKSRRFPEKNLSFSPRLRYNKEKGTALPPSERGRRPWRRRRNHAKSGTIPCWSWYWPC